MRQLSIWESCYQPPQAAHTTLWSQRLILEDPNQPLLALLPSGVYRANASQHCWCALTTPLHPYLWINPLTPSAVCFCGTSSRLPALGITQQTDLTEARTFLRGLLCNRLSHS